MWPVSTAFAEALGSSHRLQTRASVSKGGARLFSDLPVVGGSITVDSSQITRRSCTLEIAPRLRHRTYEDIPALPSSPFDPLGHYGQEVTVEQGLVYPNGVTEWIPVGVFRIEEVSGSMLSADVVTVRGVSREAFVADDRLARPVTLSGPSAQTLITSLIAETLPSAPVIPMATQDRRVPATVFEEDRWGAVLQLATSIGATVCADPTGRFVIRDAPTSQTTPVWTVSHKTVLVSADYTSSREGVYNRVVVTNENAASGEATVYGEAYDSGSTSPTRWGDPADGAYGRVTKFMSLPSISTSAQARSAAVAELARSVGASASVDLSTVPNPALEALDVIDIITTEGVERHVVDAYTMDLSPGGAFDIASRDIWQVVTS